MEHISWKYYVSHPRSFFRTVARSQNSLQIVYCVLLAFEFVYLYLFLVETKGLSLEETAALFDGEDSATEKIREHAMRQTGLVSSDEKSMSPVS